MVNVFNKYIRESGELREQLLFMDNHTAHKTAENLLIMQELEIIPHWLAKDCTDVASPVDHHVGCHLKMLVRRKYEAALEDPANFTLWREYVNDNVKEQRLSEQRRRMLMVSWVSAAWSDMKAFHDFFLSAFTSTGCLIMLDGENRVKMRGIPGMDG